MWRLRVPFKEDSHAGPCTALQITFWVATRRYHEALSADSRRWHNLIIQLHARTYPKNFRKQKTLGFYEFLSSKLCSSITNFRQQSRAGKSVIGTDGNQVACNKTFKNLNFIRTSVLALNFNGLACTCINVFSNDGICIFFRFSNDFGGRQAVLHNRRVLSIETSSRTGLSKSTLLSLSFCYGTFRMAAPLQYIVLGTFRRVGGMFVPPRKAVQRLDFDFFRRH